MPEPRAASQFVPPKAFVRSYDLPVDVDPWTFVQRYREVRTRYEGDPSQMWDALAEAIDLPADRLSDWRGEEEDATPSIVRDLTVARRHGWIAVDPGTEVFRGLNVLVATVIGMGSIDAGPYKPHFPVRTPHDIERVAWSIDHVGLRYGMVRDSEEERAREIRPRRHGSVLGRVLVVLGAPTTADDPFGLPAYLSHVSRDHRLAFARTYLECHHSREREPAAVTIGDDRSPQFLDDLAQLFTDLTGGTITREEERLVIPADAASSLGTVS